MLMETNRATSSASSLRWSIDILWGSWDLIDNIDTSSTRTRRGGSCLKDIYKTFLIYRTCMRRAPAKPVRACTLRKWCPVSHVTFEAPLRPSHFSLHSSHSTLHTSHFTLHTSHFTLHSSQSTLHTSLHASHCTLHTSHFTLHTSHCTLHTPHFISSELFSPYPSSSLLISSLLICHLSFHESLPSTSTKELDLDAKATKRRFWSTWKKEFFKGKLLAPKLRKSAGKSLSQPGCSHSNTIYNLQLQKTIVLRMQPRHQATLTQPLQCDLWRLSCKAQ